MIMRSMETLSLRMHRAATNAEQVAKFLLREDKVSSVNYLGFLEPGDPRHAVFQRQCGSAGSTFAFCVRAAKRRRSGFSMRCRSSSSREPGRHRVPDLAPGVHDTFRRAEADPRPSSASRSR
jgi:O-acetylhomoserine/O-acetylserine sulfhydrylase-like pyridoxal-dependent enzyme